MRDALERPEPGPTAPGGYALREENRVSSASSHAQLPALDLDVHNAGLPAEVSFATATYPTADGEHTCGYLHAGSADDPLIVFLHGWPELGRSFAPLLPMIAAEGYFAVAPDMRGYGASTIYADPTAYAIENAVADVRGLISALRPGADAEAIVVGHDYGAPVAWTFAAAHPEMCRAVAGMCVPHLPAGASMTAHVNRSMYPEDTFPYGQWDYMVAHQQMPETLAAEFDADVPGFIATVMRRGNPKQMSKPALQSKIRARGGWFPEGVPFEERDPRVLSEEDFAALVASLSRTGFAYPNAWYRNVEANAAFTESLPGGGRITQPALFLHARYDQVCDTLGSTMAEPMREAIPQLTERIIEAGHWVVQEKPIHTAEVLTDWLESLPHSA